MGGGCACNSSIKKYFFCSADYVINPEKNKNTPNNRMKIPEKNIKIIPREEVDIARTNLIHNDEKIKIQINGTDLNKINNDNNLINNNSYDNIINKKNVSDDQNKYNSSIYLGSELSKKKSDIVSVENNTDNINNNNNNSSYKYYFASKHQTVQKKVLEKEKEKVKKEKEKENLKKAETNYNYNLGEHNIIFINISRDSSMMKNESEKIEPTTPKITMYRNNIDDMAKGNKKIFSHFCIDKSNEKPIKNQSNLNNLRIKPDLHHNNMNNYSEEMLKAINSLRKNPESFIKYIDSMINNNIQKKDDDIFLVSQNAEEKIKLMENYQLIFEQIKTFLKDIINSKIFIDLEELTYNEELEIDIESARFINSSNVQNTCIERSSISNEKYLSHTNQCSLIKKKKKIDPNSTLNLSDDIIANLILEKRREIKNKYPYSIFKMNIIKDININILIQISMELIYNQYNDGRMLNEIIFNPKYKNFAVSWANEMTRKFISISCFA